jgi:hypothetical protein
MEIDEQIDIVSSLCVNFMYFMQGMHIWAVQSHTGMLYVLVIVTPFNLFLGLIRENDHALEEFGHQEGYSVLLRAMQSHVEKLQIKSEFLLTYICSHQPAVKGSVNVGTMKKV